MSIQKNKPEQIVTVLRQIEVQIANGKKVPQACKEAGNHTQTYYRWRKEYGGLKPRPSQTAEGIGEGECATETASGGAVDSRSRYCGMWRRETSKP